MRDESLLTVVALTAVGDGSFFEPSRRGVRGTLGSHHSFRFSGSIAPENCSADYRSMRPSDAAASAPLEPSRAIVSRTNLADRRLSLLYSRDAAVARCGSPCARSPAARSPAGRGPHGPGGVMRRTTDVVVATVAAVLLLPVIVLVVVGIWCTSGSPVLFRQERWGVDGRRFVIWKFRTMRPAAYPNEPGSARLVGFGGFLRRSSLDELPLLWNILRGDMSLLGARALPVHTGGEVVCLPRHGQQGSVRPGLMGRPRSAGRIR